MNIMISVDKFCSLMSTFFLADQSTSYIQKVTIIEEEK